MARIQGSPGGAGTYDEEGRRGGRPGGQQRRQAQHVVRVLVAQPHCRQAA